MCKVSISGHSGEATRGFLELTFVGQDLTTWAPETCGDEEAVWTLDLVPTVRIILSAEGAKSGAGDAVDLLHPVAKSRRFGSR